MINGNRRQGQIPYRSRPMKVKSPSGHEYDIEWTSDDVLRSFFFCFRFFSFRIPFIYRKKNWMV